MVAFFLYHPRLYGLNKKFDRTLRYSLDWEEEDFDLAETMDCYIVFEREVI